MTTSGALRWCAICATEQPFEQPECADGHGAECPEWVCSTCGDALLVAFDVDRVGRVRTSRADVA